MDLTLAELLPHERYKLLIGLVIPRPIAWISTRSANGVANCAPFSFFNVFSEDPPLCVIGINPRDSDGAMKHSLKNIPRIAEAAACLECKIFRLLEISATRELVLGEILLVHAREGVIDPKSKRISEEHYRPIGRLFANRYCTTRQRFNLPGELP